MESLAGKVALVTGGAQGFGLAVTHLLLKRGAKVNCTMQLNTSLISGFLRLECWTLCLINWTTHASN